MATWRKSFDQHELARRMERSRTAAGTGVVSFSGFEHSEHLVVLNGMIEVNSAIPETEKRRILNQASFDALKKSPITPDSLLRHINAYESSYLRRPLGRFRLLTGISLVTSLAVPTSRVDSSNVSFGGRLSPRAQRARQDLLRDARHSVLAELPTGYLPVSVGIQARSPHEAGLRALDAIDLLRALWNLRLNHEQLWRSSTGPQKPVNALLLSPIHSLHNEDGSLAVESWWYDPSYSGPVRLFGDKTKVERMLVFAAKLRRRLRGLAYGADLNSALIRYGRALDSRDLNDAFLRLWGILEFLTATTKKPSEITVRRAAFLFAERDYSFLVLSHLAQHRNRYVHAGSETDEIESLLYLLKRHVETLLLFHAGNRFSFASVEEAGKFLDLPSSKNALSQRIRRLQLAKKFVASP